jgi:hypothetical protein
MFKKKIFPRIKKTEARFSKRKSEKKLALLFSLVWKYQLHTNIFYGTTQVANRQLSSHENKNTLNFVVRVPNYRLLHLCFVLPQYYLTLAKFVKRIILISTS